MSANHFIITTINNTKGVKIMETRKLTTKEKEKVQRELLLTRKNNNVIIFSSKDRMLSAA